MCNDLINQLECIIYTIVARSCIWKQDKPETLARGVMRSARIIYKQLINDKINDNKIG